VARIHVDRRATAAVVVADGCHDAKNRSAAVRVDELMV